MYDSVYDLQSYLQYLVPCWIVQSGLISLIHVHVKFCQDFFFFPYFMGKQSHQWNLDKINGLVL